VSATGRSSDRPELDFARTPAWAVRAILPFLGEPLCTIDLGCGDGAIGTVLREAWGESVHIHGVELDDTRAKTARSLVSSVKVSFDPCRTYDDVTCADATTFTESSDDDLVIANPPFVLAAEFFAAAVKIVRPGGLIAFLLRGTWMVPATRTGIPLPDLRFLRRRPSFRKSAKGNSSDSTDYAWHLWRVGVPFEGGRWSVLECEPARAKRVK
jgi:hypothetical protein